MARKLCRCFTWSAPLYLSIVIYKIVYTEKQRLALSEAAMLYFVIHDLRSLINVHGLLILLIKLLFTIINSN
jgi:hypothetical protein